MKSIILFYQHYVREFSAIAKLQKSLEVRNFNVRIYSIDFELFKAIEYAKLNNVVLIVTPWMYHKRNYELFMPFVKINKKLIIVNLHHEQIASGITEKILVPQHGVAQDCVYHFVWGEFFKLLLEKYGVRTSLIRVTGNIRNDDVFLVQTIRENFANEFNLDTKKKWLLFSDNRNWVDYWSIAEKRERMLMGVSEKHLDEFFEIAKKSLDITITEFKSLSPQFFENYELIYRPHPGAQIAKGKFQESIKVISKYSIYEWLSVVDANIVWSSTTIFESDAMGIPSIVYEPFEYPQVYSTYGIEKYLKIQKLAEVDESILTKALQVQKKQNVFQYFYGTIDGQAVHRVVESIVSILENCDPTYKALQISFSKRNLFRKFLFEVLTRIMVKLNIFTIFKYPKSAWAQKNDIPYLRQ